MSTTLTHHKRKTPFARWPDLFERVFPENPAFPRMFGPLFDGGWRASSNLQETDDGFTLQIGLPGLDPDKVDVQATGQQVTIKGSYEIPLEEDASFRWHGLAGGEIAQTFALPMEIESENATATYERGILTINLPKATKVKAATIKVQKGT